MANPMSTKMNSNLHASFDQKLAEVQHMEVSFNQKKSHSSFGVEVAGYSPQSNKGIRLEKEDEIKLINELKKPIQERQAYMKLKGESGSLYMSKYGANGIKDEEYKIIKIIDHPNVVKAFTVNFQTIPSNQEIPEFRMTEYRGKMLASVGEKITDFKAIQNIARDFINGLSAIHSKKITHGDLFPRNVVLDENGATIIDFGSATENQTRFQHDIKQAGHTLAHLIIKNDFQDRMTIDYYGSICPTEGYQPEGIIEILNSFVPNCIEEKQYIELVVSMLSDQLSLEDALLHPFFQIDFH